MKPILFTIFCLLLSYYGLTQNDDCTNATRLQVNAHCINGTTEGKSIEPFEDGFFVCDTIGGEGIIPRSAWYKFNSSNFGNLFILLNRTSDETNCGYHITIYGPYSSGGCIPTSFAMVHCQAFLDQLRGDFYFNLVGLKSNSEYLIQVMNEDCIGPKDRTVDYCIGVKHITKNMIYQENENPIKSEPLKSTK
jgi:hypothetical protein